MRKNSNKFDVDIDYNPEKTKELQKVLKENWNNFDVDFRIAAVIHDGQWYTLDKIKKVAKVKDSKILENWIARHKQILIKHEVNDSYRVNSAEILKWYKQNNLKIDQEIVPKNYPPRLWAGKTETENFLDAPKELVSSLLVKTEEEHIKEMIIDVCQPYRQVMKSSIGHKMYLYTMDVDFLYKKIEKTLSSSDMKRVDIRVRNSFYRREITDLKEEFLEEALRFYFIFALALLKNHLTTMSIFLPENSDRGAQIYEWIIIAFQKYDESSGVPFSGYFANVLTKWPYDLPDDTLGKKMAGYQRLRAKAVIKLKKELNTEEISDELIFKELEEFYSKEQMEDLEESHQYWLKIQGTSNLTWSEKNDEKVGNSITQRQDNIDIRLRSKITRAILNACIVTDNQIYGVKLLNSLHDFDSMAYLDDIPELLKTEIKKQLSIILNEK